MTDFSRARRAMVDSQLRTSNVTDRRILGVMGDVPREDFVEPDRRDVAYIDDVQRLGDKASGRFMSPPATFARLVQLAEVTSADTVLDLGAGTGYSTAVLAGLADEVTGLEADAELARRGSDILARQGIGNARILAGEASAVRGRKFDVIVVEGALEREPTELFPLLKDGGRLVTLVTTRGVGVATVYVAAAGGVTARSEFNAKLPPLHRPQPDVPFVF